MRNIAVILAGGSGSRMRSDIPKQFLFVADKPVIVHTIYKFQKNPNVDEILIVCIKGWLDKVWQYVSQYDLSKVKWVIEGGSTGHESTSKAIFFLESYLGEGDYIIVHDAARPLLPQRALDHLLEVAHIQGNASLAIPCHETVILTNNQISGSEDLDRNKIMRVQTPQAYEYSNVLGLYKRAREEGKNDFVYADLVLTHYKQDVFFAKGFTNNIKITKQEDLPLCESLMQFSDEQLYSL